MTFKYNFKKKFKKHKKYQINTCHHYKKCSEYNFWTLHLSLSVFLRAAFLRQHEIMDVSKLVKDKDC